MRITTVCRKAEGMPRPQSPPDTRSLGPREHGAYGQLLAPLLSALLAGQPSLGAIALASAGVCAFLSHEPWAVLSGIRGSRALRELRPLAIRRLAVLWSATGLLGIAAFIQLTFLARLTVLALFCLGVATLILGSRALMRSAIGEVWAGMVLAFLSVPVGIAAGLQLGTVLVMWISWTAVFAAGVFAVRGLISREKPGSVRRALFGVGSVWLVLIAVAAQAPLVSLAVVPLAAACSVVALGGFSPRHLRRIGWTLMAASAFSSALMIVGVRLPLSS